MKVNSLKEALKETVEKAISSEKLSNLSKETLNTIEQHVEKAILDQKLME